MCAHVRVQKLQQSVLHPTTPYATPVMAVTAKMWKLLRSTTLYSPHPTATDYSSMASMECKGHMFHTLLTCIQSASPTPPLELRWWYTMKVMTYGSTALFHEIENTQLCFTYEKLELFYFNGEIKMSDRYQQGRNRCMTCRNVFASRRVLILPYAGRFQIDLGPEDLRRYLQQLHDNQQCRPAQRPQPATRTAPAAVAGRPVPPPSSSSSLPLTGPALTNLTSARLSHRFRHPWISYPPRDCTTTSPTCRGHHRGGYISGPGNALWQWGDTPGLVRTSLPWGLTVKGVVQYFLNIPTVHVDDVLRQMLISPTYLRDTQRDFANVYAFMRTTQEVLRNVASHCITAMVLVYHLEDRNDSTRVQVENSVRAMMDAQPRILLLAREPTYPTYLDRYIRWASTSLRRLMSEPKTTPPREELRCRQDGTPMKSSLNKKTKKKDKKKISDL